MCILCDAHVQKSYKCVKLCVITLENADIFIINVSIRKRGGKNNEICSYGKPWRIRPWITQCR